MNRGERRAYTALGVLVSVLMFSGVASAESKIAFEGKKDASCCGPTQIFVMDSDGSNLVNVSNNAFDDTNPSWSPDGSRIVFFSNRAGPTDLYSMSADGSDVVRLTTNALVDQDGAETSWSPELPPSVTALGLSSQFLGAFLLGALSVSWLSRRGAMAAAWRVASGKPGRS